mmetsp:Transcript_2308/g.5466  ORF Transcript_2308/g.5466 Transcript_2308/m.5466 type:complete len:231 (-) Transcript_2308:38-730(-)
MHVLQLWARMPQHMLLGAPIRSQSHAPLEKKGFLTDVTKKIPRPPRAGAPTHMHTQWAQHQSPPQPGVDLAHLTDLTSDLGVDRLPVLLAVPHGAHLREEGLVLVDLLHELPEALLQQLILGLFLHGDLLSWRYLRHRAFKLHVARQPLPLPVAVHPLLHGRLPAHRVGLHLPLDLRDRLPAPVRVVGVQRPLPRRLRPVLGGPVHLGSREAPHGLHGVLDELGLPVVDA